MAEEEKSQDKKFVDHMLESAEKKGPPEPSDPNAVDMEEVQDETKKIMDKIQQNE